MPTIAFRSRSVALLPVFFMTLCSPSYGLAESASLKSVSAVKALGSDAKRALPVSIRGVVTALSGWKNSFFLEDGTGGISIDRNDQQPLLQAGDRVEVRGASAAGLFAPIVVSDSIEVLGHTSLPPAKRFNLQQLLTGQQDAQRVTVRGVVRYAEVKTIWGKKVLYLRLDSGSGEASVHVLDIPEKFSQLVDSEVEVTGVCGTNFNSSGQIVGLRLFVPDIASVHIEKAAPTDPFTLPLQSMEGILRFGQTVGLDHRVRVHGTVTYQEPGTELYIQNAAHGLAVRLSQNTDVPVGTEVDAVGFLGTDAFAPTLNDAVVQLSARRSAAPPPIPVEASQLLSEHDGFKEAPYNGLLITTTAELLEQVNTNGIETFVWRSQNLVFSSRLLVKNSSTPKKDRVPAGSLVAITGVATVETDRAGDPTAIRILQRSHSDVRILSKPSWWTAQHAVWTLLATASAMVFVLIANFLLRRRVQRQVALLTETRTNYQRVLETANDAFIETDADGNILEWNASAERIFGWQRAEVLGQELAAVIVPDKDRPAHRAGLRRFAESRQSLIMNTAIETNALTRSGTLLPVELTLWAVEISGALRFDAFVRDISKRKEAEKLLKQSETMNRQILDNSPDCIKLLDLDGRLLSLNAGGCRALEIHSADPFLCSYWPDMWQGEGREAAIQGLRTALNTFQASFQGERATFKGTPKWWEVRITAILDAGGHPERLLVISRDITAQKKAEDAANEAQSQLNLALTGAQIGPWTWDLVKDRVYWHQNCAALFGMHPASISTDIGYFEELLHPEDRQMVHAKLAEAMKNGHYEADFRVVWPDNSVHVIASRGEATFSGGKPIRFAGICWDITQRTAAAKALEVSEMKLREAHAIAHLGHWEFDFNTRQFEFSDELFHIFRIPRQQGGVSYRQFRFMLPPKDRLHVLRTVCKARKNGEFYRVTLSILRPDGSTCFVDARGRFEYNAGGTPNKMLGTALDVTERVEATIALQRSHYDLEQRVAERTAALAESERHYRLLVEGVKDYAIYMLDAEGKIVSWNAGAQKIFQYDASEIVGCHFSIFHPPSIVAYDRAQDELRIAKTHEQYMQEDWRVRKDGSAFWASILITAVEDDAGKVKGFSKIVRDLTEQKHAEQLMIAAQKHADDANRTKTDFLASMSHEIRTPMNAILGMADLLWETDLDPTQRNYVQVFRRAGSNLLTLVNDILDLSKIESGYFELERIEFDLEDLIERTIEIIRPRTQAKKLELLVRVAPDTPAVLIGDPTRLQQILINLLGNATKFTDFGHVTLSVSPAENDPARLMFSVLDSGIGISKDQLDRIFDDFIQAESSTTRRYGGTGLGLGICRRLVQRMGGNLQATSEYGKGSTFSFDAVFQIAERAKAVDSRSAVGLVGRRVLVLDDNRTNRLIFTEMCAAWGMRTAGCEDTVNALSTLQQASAAGDPFDLAILDCMLPEGNSFLWIAKLRVAYPRLPIIITSSNDLPGDATRAKQLGASGFTVKPVRRSELLRLICLALGGDPPVCSDPRVTPGESRQQPVTGTHRHILIAEDSEDNRFLLQAYLKDSGYECTFVENGELAVYKLETESFDLVLMDMQMPVMDGLTATEMIRGREKETGRKPSIIVALTANARKEDMERCEAAGFTAHLSKPIAKAKLISTIEHYLPKLPSDGPQPLEIDIPSGLEEAARRYIRTRQTDSLDMPKLLDQKDFDRLRVLAHNMKGTGAPYGFPELTEIGADLEDAAKRQDAPAISDQLVRLARYVNVAVEQVGVG